VRRVASEVCFGIGAPEVDSRDTLGLRPAASNAQIRAAMIPPAIAKASGLPRGPFILLVQTIVSDAGVFLLYAHDYYRGDHFAFSVRRNRD
jgi:DNA-binding GntR family transcriptional regulator